MAIFKKMFDQTREGKGVLKDELTDKFTTLKFFRLLKRKFWRICGLNLLFIATNIFAVAILFHLAGYGSISRQSPISPLWFGPITGASQFVSNPAMSLLKGLCGVTVDGSFNGTWSYILMGIAALTLFTFGPANTGMAYILRNYTREEPCDLCADYFRTIGKNLRQSIIFGAFDLIFTGFMLFDVYLFIMGSGATALFAVIAVASSVIYITMRSYFYVMMITFDLSVFKIIKNALIFAFSNVKRNTAAFFGILFCYAFTALVTIFLTPLGALLIISCLFSITSFIGIYAAYPAIKQYMIDPVIAEERKKRKEAQKAEESIFTDMG